MRKPTAKKLRSLIEEFNGRVHEFLRDHPRTHTPPDDLRMMDYCLWTRYGPLGFTVPEPTTRPSLYTVFMRFEDGSNARLALPEMNPYTFKWNFHRDVVWDGELIEPARTYGDWSWKLAHVL